MSWSVFMGIVNFDENTKKYEVTSKIREMYCLKLLCESRCVLDEDLDPVSIPQDVHELIGKYEYYDVYKILKKDLLDFDCLDKLDRYGNNAYTIKAGRESYRGALDVLEEDDYQVRIKGNDDDYAVIYDVCTETHKGHFYNMSTFRNYANKLRDEYNALILKKGRMQRIQNSLKYMALSEERKENVLSEYEYLDEEIEDTENKLNACLYVIGILEYYDDFDNRAYVYIYSE